MIVAQELAQMARSVAQAVRVELVRFVRGRCGIGRKLRQLNALSGGAQQAQPSRSMVELATEDHTLIFTYLRFEITAKHETVDF